ncbi:MAG TPA: HlyD family efflux transporter periplasmic adaptor subunit [Anaerolineales bacterium]|nr:HlyD family efflux transporter periplasmic adaptor subunit [Anaerolineales bacterium]
MNRSSLRRVLPALLVLILVGAGLAYLASVSAGKGGPLEASGTIESIQVNVAAEVSGRVLDVLVDEGESVGEGDPLVRLDDRLLQAQRESARAAGEAAIAAAELEAIAAQQALDDLFTTAPLAAAQAEKALAEARDVLDTAERTYTWNQEGNRATSDTLKAAKAKLAVERERMERAEAAYRNASGDLSEGGEKAAAFVAYNNARIAYNRALSSYNWYTGHPTDIDQAQLEADVALAQAQVDDAQRRLEEVQSGPDPAALDLAQARLALAGAQVAAAEAKAEVDLQVLDLQLEKLLIRAPLGGVVTMRYVEPGEVLLAGAPALSISDLDRLMITVYLPEDQYGRVGLGDPVRLTVDSFPAEVFEGSVVRIADQAEFTPRNVQTETGRRSTVFAVEIAVRDETGKLKPGMPADVAFGADD